MADLSMPAFAHESLVELARLGRLPRHQYMDAATLFWITQNRPYLDKSPAPMGADRLPVHPCDVLIPPRWFAEPAVIDSIHGIRHAARTAVYAGYLARHAEVSVAQAAEVVVAAVIHDCRRLHDQDDRGHGRRAAEWFRQNHPLVLGAVAPATSTPDPEPIAIAVELHDIPYNDFTRDDADKYQKARAVTDIVKAADALDRYRLPKVKWWPSSGHLRLAPPEWLHAYAFDLIVATEARRLRGTDNAVAIRAALQEVAP